MSINKGKLFVVGTPIGNLDDITFRAIEILKHVAFILAEDTRHSINLLKKYSINTQLISYRDQNHERMIDKIVEKLDMGLDLALISDAGTPCISDPGYRLVKELNLKGYEVLSIPGPSSVISALSISGVATDKFVFLGFLPKSDKKIKDILLEYGKLDLSLVIFESPNRVRDLMKMIFESLGDRYVAVVNDITKIHEKVIYDKCSNFINDFPILEKGEFVILIDKE